MAASSTTHNCYRLHVCVCCLRIKPFFLPNDVSTPSQSVSLLILHPREMQILWSHRNRVNHTVAIHQGKASEVLAYRVREHNETSQTMKKMEKKKGKKKRGKKEKKTTGVLENVTQEDRLKILSHYETWYYTAVHAHGICTV